MQALERQEKALVADIKKAAQQGNKKATNIYAKQLIQVRQSREKLNGVSMHLSTVGTQAQLMATNAAALQAVGSTAAVMQKVNTALSPAATGAMMKNFEREMTKMDLNMEQLDEFLEEAFDGDDVEEEADEIVAETLAGIGIDLNESMAEAPMGAPAIAGQAAAADAAAAAAAPAEPEDAAVVNDLEARLASLGGL